MTLSEIISAQYSNVAHLSNQFKRQVLPDHFKQLKDKREHRLMNYKLYKAYPNCVTK
jgi:hypothetical protein